MPSDHAKTSTEYEVIIIRHGTRMTTKSDVFLNFHLYHEPDGPFRVDYFLWVLRNRERTILIDTGFSHAAALRRGRAIVVDPLEALAHLGIDPTAAHQVVLTHAHYDHIGNVANMPAAQFHISERELSLLATDESRKPLIAFFTEWEEVEQLQAAKLQGRVHAVKNDGEIAPGVQILQAPGHTPGQLMVQVRTTQGSVLLTSDAVHFVQELERDWPFTSMTHLTEGYMTLDYVRKLRPDHLVTGHDPGTLRSFARHPEVAEGWAAVIGYLGAT